MDDARRAREQVVYRIPETCDNEGRFSGAWKSSALGGERKWNVPTTGRSVYCSPMELYERLIGPRLREVVPISQEQYGFISQRSTTDAIFIGRVVIKMYGVKRRHC